MPPTNRKARGAVDRSVAEVTVGWMIALTHHVRVKDQLLREGRWEERTKYFWRGLRDRTFSAVGLNACFNWLVTSSRNELCPRKYQIPARREVESPNARSK